MENMPITTSTSRNTQGSGCLTLFGLVFAIPGIAVGVSTVRKVIAGTIDVQQIVLGFTMAVLFMGVGIGLIVWSRISASLFGAVFLGSGLFFGVAGGQVFGWIVGLIPITLAGGIGLFLLVFTFRWDWQFSGGVF